MRVHRRLFRTKVKHVRHQRQRMRYLHSILSSACDEVKASHNPSVVVLTGAGISAESGIRTFRASDGLWEDHRIEDVATPEGFEANPELVQAFYNARRRQLISPEILPNDAHKALAKLEDLLGNKFLLVTQNVDNLHERAGNMRVIHMHGELLKIRCTRSGKVAEWKGDLSVNERCYCCEPPQPMRPHIVWFGEMPLEMDKISQAIAEADYFIAIGTSGHVYPAAGFVRSARLYGAHTVELNLEPSQVANSFEEKHCGLASQVVPEYIQQTFLDVISKDCCKKA
ncbi:Sir2 family NAD+-dependent deacetylase [Pragia fontium]|uniref:NAD-dependent protein deacylase n=2 Tax=Pragia fontium TaxID=82985 RepID=A0AAJ4W9F6_9GAMM|nr:Sir2 family NAD+-dependent deacetylase [Pragia fontium]AKJ42040.1 NAD-dependent deacetylase [Pragia fontium]SFC46526.1 NAD-dependent deacetylase [Pragia fontium DSM 5563 = ATCC 49100]SUB82274.1 NAD-dependent deacetylase [Pragia fontium]VEJ55076.1 NAD-dependent deacetylase [Pragia fontium]GKX61929.1 NAD-dependent protein deacylase [Pragia fontium]